MKSNLRITAAARFISLFMAFVLCLSGCGSANTGDTSMSMNSENVSEESEDISVEQGTVDIVGEGTEESSEDETAVDTEAESEIESETETDTAEEPETETEKEPELTAEQLLWQTRLISNVKSNLNVRKEPDAESSVVGKMPSGAVGTIIEKGEEWTLIKSGNLEGYVSNEYCLFGEEAYNKAKTLYDSVATATVNGLRLRADMSTESTIITKLDKGDDLIVNYEAETIDGWVAVLYREETYYVSADYVVVDMDYETGLTKAELKAIEEEKEKQKQQAALAAITDKRDRNEAETKLVAAEKTDEEVLAAIVYCEAGGESYETQLAVASAIMNRVKSSRYPDTIKGVVLQKYQFSPVRSGSLLKRLKSGKVKASCLKAAQEAMSGVDNTNGCTSFRADDGSKKGKFYSGGMVFY